jgi:predicted nuclease of predicted toxin-antitoxin system
MDFLIDAQLPISLARWIDSQQGHRATHVFDRDLMEATDRLIWQHAHENHLIIVTKDHDFVILSTLEASGPAVVWIRLGNTRKQALLKWFEDLFPDITSHLQQGERLVEIVK